MKFQKLDEFGSSYHFFMTRPSNAIAIFIFMIAFLLLLTFFWALTARMDDIVSASAFLRPANTISTVKPLVGGEVKAKYYSQNDYISEGDLLLQLDSSADTLELANSKELMARINNGIVVHTTLLETIRSGRNAAPLDNYEAYIQSERYVLESQQHALLIAEVEIKLRNERNLPALTRMQMRLEEMERELEQANLTHALWKNSSIIEANNTVYSLLASKESLERRIVDLERNIKNAAILSPISGRIHELRSFNVGDNILPGEELINIIPVDEMGLKAELYIEPAYIARIMPGQKAVLSFPGLPPSRFGKIETEISLIPADYNYLQYSSPFFIVETNNIDPVFLSQGGEEIFLRAGINATCRIIIDNDTVLRMFLRKLDFLSATY